jgi:microcystin-dependent protein
MSYFRAKNRAINKNVYDANRLAIFNKPPIKTGDLYVERDEEIARNLTIGGDLRARNYYASGNYYLDNYILIPYGTIIQSAAVNIPDGWLLCNGAFLSKIVYSDLFGVIGNTYGGTESDASFNIPDIRGRVIVGTGTGSGLTTRNLGSTGGEETHTLTINEMPAHTHSYVNNVNDQSLNNTISTESAADNADITATTGSTGGSQAHNNMQPYIVLNYLIKY